MREYVRDFRMFAGRSAMIGTLWYTLAMVVGFFIFLAIWAFTENEALKGFCEGFLPVFCLSVPIIGYIPCNMVFNYNRAVSPGYKYFHSLPDSAKRFRRAVLVCSIYPLAIVLVWAAVLWLWSPVVSLLILFAELTLKGAQNVFGHARNIILMFLPMMAVVFSMGFIVGFTTSEDESFISMEMEPKFALPLAIVGTAVFVIGTVYSVLVAEKKWNREP